MRKKVKRLSKRVFILFLCTCLTSGAVINKNKIEVHATGLAVSLGAYTAYEICLYIGTILVSALGLGIAIDNRDEIAEVGKNFIDSMQLDDLQEWLLTKVNTTGQSYVFGSEALKEVQEMEFSVIQGGGNMPENNQDNDNDGDIDADDRTEELKNLGLWATASFADLICDQIQPIWEEICDGKNNFVTDALQLNEVGFSGYKLNEDGLHDYMFVNEYYDSSGNVKESVALVAEQDVFVNECCLVYSGKSASGDLYYFYYYDVDLASLVRFTPEVMDSCLGSSPFLTNLNYARVNAGSCGMFTNLPVFESKTMAEEFFRTGLMSLVSNLARDSYRIADWLQEDWAGLLESLNTGIRSLNGNLLIVGDAMNQALQNQLNGLGYISAINDNISSALPLVLPDAIADPIYYPASSNVPELDPSVFPWYSPSGSPDSTEPSDPDGSVSEEEIRGDNSFGLDTIFGILILLIMILIMLLMIFLSCLAFIIMIFRIEATTGFLPPDMIAGLDYIKSLQIPGFGMSVYDFFMSLIYIILIFTVIGVLRKNIDKIRFPRKGKW